MAMGIAKAKAKTKVKAKSKAKARLRILSANGRRDSRRAAVRELNGFAQETGARPVSIAKHSKAKLSIANSPGHQPNMAQTINQ